MADAMSITTEPSVEDTGGPEVGILVRLQGLPEAVFAYVMSDELVTLHKTIFEKHGLSQKDRDMAYYTELQTFLGEISLADFPDMLWNRLPWEDAQESKMASLVIDILGFIFLPAQAHLGDVAGLISELGGDLKSFPEKQLEVRRITYAEGAAEVAAAADLDEDDVDGDGMRKRLAYIVESRLRHVRTDVDVREMLMRGKKTGGIEMSAAAADKVIELLESKARMTSYAESHESESVKAESANESEFTAADIKKIYAGSPGELESLGKRVDRFMSVTASNPSKMRDAFYQVIEPPDGSPIDPLYVVAGLISMADGDKISDALVEDDRYRAIVREYLTGKNRQAELPAYEEDPTDAKYMNVFLQYLLRGIAGYDEAESARFALRIINLLNKQGYNRYADLVAFSMKEGEFRWHDVVEP